MTLKLYNTRTRTKEAFQPLDPANVRMYVCGPTVYDYAHIGNARPVIVFDVLYRLLRHLYGESHVTYVRNITDVDDKINARAVEQYPEFPPEAAIRKLTEETTVQYHKDVAALGCLPPTHEPRATEYIKQMKAMIETLVDKGCAYIAEDHALFHVSAMPDYGQLARRSLDEMRAGARVEVAPYKRDPMDFVLWKPSKDGEPSWPSPRGINAPGRPGWHLECSAMAEALLGETFDIHGGGIDLVFPHHENEVAQSRCAHGTDIMANVWMHNGHLQVEGAKMSKSDGNFFTIHELLQEWPGEVLRLAMLMTHYREPINWTKARLLDVRQELWDWVSTLDTSIDEPVCLPANQIVPDQRIFAPLLDDLNTPLMITEIRALAKAARSNNRQAAERLRASLMWLGMYRPYLHDAYEILGAFSVPPAHAYKHLESLLRARAVVLNQYDWDTRDLQIRMMNRATVEEKINGLSPELKLDGLRLKLQEHGGVSLAWISTAQERKVAQEQASIQRTADELAKHRNSARKVKNFAEADRIRDKAAELGIALKETKDPATGEIITTWEIAR